MHILLSLFTALTVHATEFSTIEATCKVIEAAAAENNLPLNFFTRLIWQESRFDSTAVSPAGAQGVAQFMPRTAAGRGLTNPFATDQALHESASYLRELREMFGNLGLAAAAYNFGPGNLSLWSVGERELPSETEQYVQIVTGHTVAEWHSTSPPTIDSDDGFSCTKYAQTPGVLPKLHPSVGVSSVGKPWSVILVGSIKQSAAMQMFEDVRHSHMPILANVKPRVVYRRVEGQMPRYIVQVEKDTRVEADEFCRRLSGAGGSCFVLKSSAR